MDSGVGSLPDPKISEKRGLDTPPTALSQSQSAHAARAQSQRAALMTHQSPGRPGSNTAPNRRQALPSANPSAPKNPQNGAARLVLGCQQLALGMERVRGAGAVLAVLVVLGAPPAAGEELSGVFQRMGKFECHFINGTKRVRFLQRSFYNREQYMDFDSDVGVYVGDNPFGEIQARYFNSDQEELERQGSAVDIYCRHNY
ncbi:H-2 class II histocompatibility antigen, I-E beta chain-like [Pseudopipra pipra]|uniref:H-2 class II histocompatibility antigen, I-E beta chain-like n=1 Tax=Pseudopipra pipra TaxID=415032 RepID=UPI0031397057